MRGCDRECKPCPLFDLCGGIELYGVIGYSCPFAGCRLEFPAIKRMQECGVCRHGRITWDMNEDNVRRLVAEVKNLGIVKASPHELPPIVPIVSLRSPSSYHFKSMLIDNLIVMFEDLFDEEIRSKVERAGDIHSYLNFDGKVLASSIMPDDIITQEEVFYYFLDTVDRLKFDGAIAWDSPVYIDIPLYDSWVNLLMGLKLTHELADWGMPVYGLAKGNTDGQIAYSVKTLKRIGITSMALHASEYMVALKSDSTVRQTLYTYFRELAESAESVLIVGALNPKWFSFVSDSFPKGPRLSIAGLSWFLDAERGLLYSDSGHIDATGKYVECKCSTCSGIGPRDLMSDVGARARHNLNYLFKKDVETPPHPLAACDLLLSEDEEVLLVSDIHIWTDRELLDSFLEFLREQKPAYIIFLGDVFDLKGRPDPLETAAFFEALRELGALVFVVKGCSDSDQEDFLSAFDRLMITQKAKPKLWSEEEPTIAQACLDLYRFFKCAKEELNIRLANGALIVAKHGHDIVEDPSLSRKAMVKQIEEARTREHAKWLIIGHLHWAFIDEARKVASTGCWALGELYEERLTAKEDLMAYIVVHGNGMVELRRRE